MGSSKGLCTNIIQVFLATTHPRGNHPNNRHTPIKNIPIHSTSYRPQSLTQPPPTHNKHTDTFHKLPTNLRSNRHTPISRGLGRLLSVACGMYRCVFLSVCAGCCLRDWPIACGMCRYVFYGCVSVALEIGHWRPERPKDAHSGP